MNEKNLPVKIVIHREKDVVKNRANGGGPKEFVPFTNEIKNNVMNKFHNINSYYENVFKENELMPAVGKIIVKNEAIAKSHKPNDLCKKCEIIGTGELNEIYIKVTKKSLKSTINLIEKANSKNIRANMTIVEDVTPVYPIEKISENLQNVILNSENENFSGEVKIKLFDFDNEYDNTLIKKNFRKNLEILGLNEGIKEISYNSKHIKNKIELMTVKIKDKVDLEKISKINGVKFIDSVEEFTTPNNGKNEISDRNFSPIISETSENIYIGVIDSGISEDNKYLAPFVEDRVEKIKAPYQNRKHGTFIASTILYGNELNNLTEKNPKSFKLIDIIAIPNNDPKYGPTLSINEFELMEIIEEALETYHTKVKIWNLSLGTKNIIGNKHVSDFGQFLDFMQEKYEVQFFLSSGNFEEKPYRSWPPENSLGDLDRIISPADTIRGITVGSLALHDSKDSIVNKNEPSPFSRKGPGANYVLKPDLVDYGGNINKDYTITSVAMNGLDVNGNIVEDIGTSLASPRVTYKYAHLLDEMAEIDLLLAKGLLIHASKLSSRNLYNDNKEYNEYIGFGMPPINTSEILKCSDNEITLIFKQKITHGNHLEMIDFPFPKSLIKNEKYFGKIAMTLVYNPILDEKFGKEYCRTNIDVSFGPYRVKENGEVDFKSEVPLEANWSEKFEQAQVKGRLKWSPVKSYYRNIVNGIKIGSGWKIRINLRERNELYVPEQEFALIITLIGEENDQVYTDVVNELREKGFVTNNLEVKNQIRQKV